MRISDNDLKIIQSKIKEFFGDVEAYIFGSIINDKKRGRDIDIYIRVPFSEESFKKKIKLQMILEDILFRPVDIVIEKNRNSEIKK